MLPDPGAATTTQDLVARYSAGPRHGPIAGRIPDFVEDGQWIVQPLSLHLPLPGSGPMRVSSLEWASKGKALVFAAF